MTEAQKIAQALGAKETNGSYICKCPAHEDKKESLSITVGDNGKTLLKCFAGCDFNQITASLEAMGLWGKEAAPKKENVRRKTVAEYIYLDEQDRQLYKVCRTEPKGFFQKRLEGSQWVNGLKGVRRVLYNLPQILREPNRLVVLVEGEKDADNVTKLGFLATTNLGGASNVNPALLEPLRGRKVAICRDNDKSGLAWESKLSSLLLTMGCQVRIIDSGLLNLGEKEDISDWINRGGEAAQLKQIISAIKPLEKAPEPVAEEEDSEKGKITKAKFPDYISLAERRFGKLGRDLFSDRLHYKDKNGVWKSIYNKEKVLRGDARFEEEMKVSVTCLRRRDHLHREKPSSAMQTQREQGMLC